ncbi:aldo/keto reductase [Ophiocordyceps sinensis CO18]|uniref:GCS light chain n=1 Tax=Ophiocordyceps sinensis (strain Co18 / CGMCC 3.14243) TaxID=911162 RepID=T5ALF9_OPHSC|nr:aldo/keto reductase [Ophiocordyceps sinensis CO18]
MTNIVLSTGNVMSAGGPPLIRKSGSSTRSNLELVSSLRYHFTAARHDYAPETNGSETPPQAPVDAWTARNGKTLQIPRIPHPAAGLREEASQYEITVKLFLLPDTPVVERERYAREALALVGKELGVQTIDLLVISFPGMSFEGNCEWEADKINAQQGNLEDQLATWEVFEELHRQGVAKKLGVADTDILPRGTLRELLGHGPQGAGVLADAANNGTGLRGDILPQWVVRYMAFVRDRGVIENKGYFAGAELVEG